MKVLVTGGAGLIGHRLVLELHALGHEVTVFDAFTTLVPELREQHAAQVRTRLALLGDRARVVRGDVTDLARLRATVEEADPEVVVHLANVPVSSAANRFFDEATRINLGGTINLIQTMRAVRSVRRLVYASSSYVYGDYDHEPMEEDRCLAPQDPYGGMKAASELLIRGVGTGTGFEWVVVRPAAVYGPTGCNGAVSQVFVENALRGVPLKLVGGGTARLDFTHVADVARGMALAATVPAAANQVFNITRGEGRSLREFAAIVRALAKDVTITETAQPAAGPRRGASDITKARRLLGYEPRYSLEEGIAEYLAALG